MNSVDALTELRCSARSTVGLPARCKGDPKNARPSTPGKGDIACACEVIGPPTDLPPANKGRDDHIVFALATAARTGSCATAGASTRFLPTLHVRESIAERADLALRQTFRHGGHERIRHVGIDAMREHIGGFGLARHCCDAVDDYAAGRPDIERAGLRRSHRLTVVSVGSKNDVWNA